MYIVQIALIAAMERGRIDLSKLQVLVLDEADRMLDMSMIETLLADPGSFQRRIFWGLRRKEVASNWVRKFSEQHG